MTMRIWMSMETQRRNELYEDYAHVRAFFSFGPLSPELQTLASSSLRPLVDQSLLLLRRLLWVQQHLQLDSIRPVVVMMIGPLLPLLTMEHRSSPPRAWLLPLRPCYYSVQQENGLSSASDLSLQPLIQIILKM